MDNIYFQISLFTVSILFFIVFIFVRLKGDKDRKIFNTFPYEISGLKISNIFQLFPLIVSSICSITLCTTFIFGELPNNFLNCASILIMLSTIAFLFLSIINLSNLNFHLGVFSLHESLSFLTSLMIGFGGIRFFNISGTSNFYLIIAIVSFVFMVAKLIIILNGLKISLKLDKNENETLKRPSYVKMAFYEWLFKIFIFIDSLLLIIINMI